jgi:hypothetical protein
LRTALGPRGGSGPAAARLPNRAGAAREAYESALSDLGYEEWMPDHPLGDLGTALVTAASCKGGPFVCILALIDASLLILDLESEGIDPEVIEQLEQARAELDEAEAAHDECLGPAREAYDAYSACYQHNAPDVDIKDRHIKFAP